MDKLIKNKLEALGVDEYNMKKIKSKKERPGYILSVPSSEGWLLSSLSEIFDVNLGYDDDRIVYKIHRKRGGVG